MQTVKKILILFVACFTFFFAKAQEDSVLYARDSVIEIEKECYERFFELADQIPDLKKITVITKAKRTQTLAAFKEANDMGHFSQQCLSDLDGDGKMELLVWNYTGGAHCCDELYVFKNIAPNKYQFVANTFAGNVCITESKEAIYSFSELFGYFFTCYACAYEDTSVTGPVPVHSIILKYNKGKLSVQPGNAELKNIITDNLAKLGELTYQPLNDEIDQDNGLRKEFALNLAVFYYSFGKNLVETKKLFDKYYRYPDAKKVWSEFVKTLNWIKSENSF